MGQASIVMLYNSFRPRSRSEALGTPVCGETRFSLPGAGVRASRLKRHSDRRATELHRKRAFPKPLTLGTRLQCRDPFARGQRFHPCIRFGTVSATILGAALARSSSRRPVWAAQRFPDRILARLPAEGGRIVCHALRFWQKVR